MIVAVVEVAALVSYLPHANNLCFFFWFFLEFLFLSLTRFLFHCCCYFSYRVFMPWLSRTHRGEACCEWQGGRLADCKLNPLLDRTLKPNLPPLIPRIFLVGMLVRFQSFGFAHPTVWRHHSAAGLVRRWEFIGTPLVGQTGETKITSTRLTATIHTHTVTHTSH